MLRTQISLSEDLKQLLDARSAQTGLSMSELIRRAIRATYGRPQRDLAADLAVLERTAGAWKDRDFDGEEYVERLRAVDRKP